MDYSDITQLGIGTTQLMRGWQESIIVADPAAGSGFNRNIPPETWERLLAVKFTLTTSAAVANRTALLAFEDGDSNVLARYAMTGAVAASQTITVFADTQRDNVLGTTTGDSYASFSDFVLPAAYNVAVTVNNIDVADTLTDIRFIIQRYPSDVASGDEYLEHLSAWREFWAKLRSGQIMSAGA